MKRLTVILFFAGILAQSFTGAFVILDYYANTEAFAQNCINKMYPMMHCNGKCQMMKKLRDEEDKKDQSDATHKLEYASLVYASSSFYAGLIYDPVCITIPYGDLSDGKPVDRPASFFHPPGIV